MNYFWKINDRKNKRSLKVIIKSIALIQNKHNSWGIYANSLINQLDLLDSYC